MARTTLTLLAALGAACALPAAASTPVVAPIDFSACANTNSPNGAPVGTSVGNAGTKDSKLTFTLLDPSTGNNAWVGGAGGTLSIKLSVATPSAVYLLMNSFYGQSGVANATIIFSGTNGAHKKAKLVGNTTIRDWNNWVWTNTINGTTAQEWWTNNLNPQPDDQSHRLDAHYFNLGTAFAGNTLTKIEIKAPSNAGVNYMEPALFAAGVVYPGGGGAVKSSCKAK